MLGCACMAQSHSNQTYMSRFSDLDTFTGGDNSEAYAINNLNEIAGASQISGGTWRGFTKKPGGNLIQVNPPSGTDSVYLQGINDSGVAVGAYPNPLIWQEGMSTGRHLNDMKAASPSFYIYGAEAINNQMVVVGWGYDGSVYTAFMLTPP